MEAEKPPNRISSPVSTVILTCLLAAVSYLVARLGGTLMLRDHSVWPLWPGCAFLVSVLLLTPRRIWPILIATGLAAFALYDVQEHVPARSIVWLMAADTVEILLAALSLSYFFNGVPRLNSVKALAKYSFFAIILAPAVTAFIGSFAVGGNYWVIWRLSFLSEALAFLTVAPAFWGWFRQGPAWSPRPRAYYLEAAVLLAALTFFGYLTLVASENTPPALIYSLVPFLLWSALRFGSTGVSTSMIVIAFLSIWGAVHGGGLFNQPEPLGKVLSVQLFLLCTAVPFMVLAALVEDHKAAAQELKRSEEKFSTAFQSSPVFECILSLPDLRYVEVNKTYEERSGYQQGEVAGRTISETGIWADSKGVEQAFQGLSGEKHVHGVEGRFRTKTGETHVGLLSAEVVEFRGGPCILAVIEDITERKRAEEAVRESEERFRLVANTAPVLIWMAGPDKLCTYFNRPWLDFTGRSVEEELGNGWTEGVHPEDRDRCLDSYTRAFDGRQSFRIEYRLRRNDGEYRWIVDLGVPRVNADGSFAGYIGSAIDVTDRKRGEEALATVSGRLIEAQEQERARIARDLHDDISQRLALLAIELQRLKDNPLGSLALVRKRSEHLLQLTSEIATDVRALSHQLHSSKLEILGLLSASRGFCREFAAQREVEIDFSHSNVPSPLAREVALCLFRVLQEALLNGVRHSGARRFEVQLRGESDAIQLMVRDAGAGFDPEAAINKQGLGLISMRERVGLVKGTISITSKPMGGTEIRVRVPVSAAPGIQQARVSA
ncbi:MAG TPA: PAS domain S-box protein [Terriglobia bacterium]